MENTKKAFSEAASEIKTQTLEKFIHDEKKGLDYQLVGDYYLPMLNTLEAPKIGRFGRMHHDYIRKNKKCFFGGLQLSGKMNNYIEQVDRDAEEMFEKLVIQLAENEGITEQLKADNQLEWVRRMNNIRNRVEETVKREMIFR